MARPILIQRWRGATGQSVFKFLNGNSTMIGNAFGVEGEDASDGIIRTDSVIHWQNKLYAVETTGIYRLNPDGSDAWELIHTFTSGASLLHDRVRMGLYPVLVSGEQVLLTLYPNQAFTNGNSLIPIVMDKNENVFRRTAQTPGTVSAHIDASKGFRVPIVWNNTLVWGAAVNNSDELIIYQYDPVSETLSSVDTDSTIGTNSNSAFDFLVFGGRLYFLAGNNTLGGLWGLYRLEGSSTAQLVTFFDRPTSILEGQVGLFTDNTYMYAIVYSDSQSSWGCFQFDVQPTGISISNISTTTLPASMLSTSSTDGRIWINTQIEDTLNGTPEILVMWADDGPSDTQTVSVYQWNGPMQQMSFLGAGANSRDFAFVHDKVGGGHRTYTGTNSSGEFNVILDNPVIIGQDINLNARVNGRGVVQTGVSMELFFDRNGKMPITLGTIIASTSGTVNNGIVEGLTLNGIGNFTITWAAADDGVIPSDSPIAVARLFL